MSVALESIIPVACKKDVFFLVVIVGLQLALLVNGSLDFLKNILVLTVPHSHKALRQPVGHFFFFLANL